MTSSPSAETLDAAWSILKHYPELHWTQEDLAHHLIFVNAEALAVFNKVLDEAELLLIATHPDHLQQGYAQALLESSIAELKVRAVFLEVRPSNLPAQKLYEKLGFLQISERKKYYQNPTEDAIIFKKTLYCSI